MRVQWNVSGKTASALPDHLASSRCGGLPPGWRPRLASAARGNPAAGYRLPPAGGQRSWLFSPSPPPPSHNPSTWSPEDAAAPSSPLGRETRWKDVRTTCNHSCDRSVSARVWSACTYKSNGKIIHLRSTVKLSCAVTSCWARAAVKSEAAHLSAHPAI